MSEEETKGEHSKSTGDNVSKSDTQDDISDKIFDNISTHRLVHVSKNRVGTFCTCKECKCKGSHKFDLYETKGQLCKSFHSQKK